LLNTVLTVEHSKPLSPSRSGWEQFTDVVMKYFRVQEEIPLFLFVGKPCAKKMKSGINLFPSWRDRNHVILSVVLRIGEFWVPMFSRGTNECLKKFW